VTPARRCWSRHATALLGAWRGLAGFEGRSSLRSWLYRIATNACLRLLARRPRRVLAVEYGPAAAPEDDLGEPVAEPVFLQPYPDDRLGPQDRSAAPEGRYELRESVELAFVAALQHLPAAQRAVLILQEVPGFSAAEVAGILDLLAEDARFSMPPLRAWFRGREDVGRFFAERVFASPWRLLPIRANGPCLRLLPGRP
jgi:RNA polymerase sigma factor (sigma-70 family)